MKEFSKATPRERRLYLIRRNEALKAIRSDYLATYKKLAKYIAPFSGCFSKADKPGRRDMSAIYDNKASRCVDTLVGGLSSYATSPSLPWFRLVGNNNDYQYDHEAQLWLQKVQSIILDVFRRSNTYNSLHELYHNLCVFGTAASVVVEDPNTVIHHHVLPIGTFCLQNDEKGNVSTLYREFTLTAVQAVRQFGYDKLSRSIRRAYDEGNTEVEFRFIHAIEPREDRNLNSKSNLDMEWASYYIEGAADDG